MFIFRFSLVLRKSTFRDFVLFYSVCYMDFSQLFLPKFYFIFSLSVYRYLEMFPNHYLLNFLFPLLPQLLSRVGDIPDLAALAAPKRLLFRRPMDLDGRYLDWSRAANLFVHAQRAYRAAGAEDRIRLCHFLNAYSLPLTARECVGEFIREDSI